MARNIQIKVVPRAKKSLVKETAEGLKIYTPAPAVDGKANEAVIEQLAEYLGVKKRQVVIVRGEHSRLKIININH